MLEFIGKGELVQFPCARIHIDDGHVVVFFSEHEGVVLLPDKYDKCKVGQLSSCLPSCFDREEWEPVDIKISG